MSGLPRSQSVPWWSAMGGLPHAHDLGGHALDQAGVNDHLVRDPPGADGAHRKEVDAVGAVVPHHLHLERGGVAGLEVAAVAVTRHCRTPSAGTPAWIAGLRVGRW